MDAVAVIGSVYNGEEVTTTPKVGTETGLPEEELPTELTENVVPDIGTPSPSPSREPEQSAVPSQEPAPSPAATAVPSAAPSQDQPAAPAASSVRKGYSFTAQGMTYVVTDAAKKTVSLKAPASKKLKTAAVPATVKTTADGTTYVFRVTAISDKAFAGCSALKKITIGKNVTSIGKEAFAKDKALKKIVIKSTGLTKVGKNAVKGISAKAKISCGKNAKTYKKLFTAKTGYKKSMKIGK